jgi:hypothetical protein
MDFRMDCPYCEAEAQELKRCAKCDARLQEECGRCRALTPVFEERCAACGTAPGFAPVERPLPPPPAPVARASHDGREGDAVMEVGALLLRLWAYGLLLGAAVCLLGLFDGMKKEFAEVGFSKVHMAVSMVAGVCQAIISFALARGLDRLLARGGRRSARS